MPDGATTELMEPPVSVEAPPTELPTSFPEIPTPQESHTPLITPSITNAVDEDMMRREVQNMIAAQEASRQLELPNQNSHEKKQKRNIGEFLAKHKMLGLMLSPILLIFASIFGAFRQDRSGGQSH